MGLVKDFQNSVKDDFAEMFPNPQLVKAVINGEKVQEYDRTSMAKRKAKAVVGEVVNGAVTGLAPMMAGRRMPNGADNAPPPQDNDMEME